MRTNCAQTPLPHTAGHTPTRPRPRARALPRRAALRVARGCAALALRALALRRSALLRFGRGCAALALRPRPLLASLVPCRRPCRSA